MFNLNDIMLAAQRGAGIDNLARYSGLTREQATAAVDALLPAFSLGLKRQTESMEMFSRFAKLMGVTGPGLYDGVSAWRPSTAWSEGVFGQLFGSPDMTKAIAEQAAAMSGITTQTMTALMPQVAAMLMGGLFSSAQDKGMGGAFMWPQAGASPSDMFGQWMQAFAMGSMSGSTLPGNPLPGNPIPTFGTTTGSPDAAPDMSQAGLNALTQMFDTGRDMQNQQARAMRELFEAMFGGNTVSAEKPAD